MRISEHMASVASSIKGVPNRFAYGATKAGVLPMGDWLPDAHPVAPSGVSAMLSGAARIYDSHLV